MTIDLQLGHESRTFDTEEVENDHQRSPFVSGSLGVGLSRAARAELGYRYRITETEQALFASSETGTYNALFHYAFSDRTRADFAIVYGHAVFDVDQLRLRDERGNPLDTTDIQTNFEEDTLQYSITFRARVTEAISAEIGWRYTDIDSDFPGTSFTRNRYFAGIYGIF